MNNERDSQIQIFVRNQLAQSAVLLKNLTVDRRGRPLPIRGVYDTVNGYMHSFAQKESDIQWIAVAGLRGVGKTTLLAQLYTRFSLDNARKLYLSLDRAQDLGFGLSEILAAYEELLGTSFELLDTPVFLFLDEVQYQPTWAVTIKTLVDRSKNIFVVATGSSAIALQTNADVARRMVLEKLYPLSFAEYITAKSGKTVPQNLGARLTAALFSSKTAQEVYEKLKAEQGAVTAFWTGVERFEIDRYLKYGSLPFALHLDNEQIAYLQLQTIMENIINRDVTVLNAFDNATLNKLSQLLYAIAGADIVSLPKLSETLSLDPKTVVQALETLEKAEVLLRVYPYGAHYSQVKKPSKYLFTSSAYRAMYYNFVGSVEQYDQYKGKLLEDVMGMYLFRLFAQNPGVSITYDSAEKGADFILATNLMKQKIVIEVGTGKKNFNQALATLQKVDGTYGLVVSQSRLMLDTAKNCVSVPLEYFLLA